MSGYIGYLEAELPSGRSVTFWLRDNKYHDEAIVTDIDVDGIKNLTDASFNRLVKAFNPEESIRTVWEPEDFYSLHMELKDE